MNILIKESGELEKLFEYLSKNYFDKNLALVRKATLEDIYLFSLINREGKR